MRDEQVSSLGRLADPDLQRLGGALRRSIPLGDDDRVEFADLLMQLDRIQLEPIRQAAVRCAAP